jgi:hypothetical protein
MKKRSSLLSIVLFVIIVGLAFLAGPLFDRLFAPWAFEQAGRPALTGHWIGQLTTATGQTYGVLLELLLPEPEGRGGLVRDWESDPYGEIAGTARVCDAVGQVRVYTIEGEPEDRQATRITFYATPGETPAPNGLTISWVNGAWDGANSLMLTAQLYWQQDGSAISGPEYPDTQAEAALPMTRGSSEEFESICSRVKAAEF